MRRKGTARFVAGLVVAVALGQACFARAMTIGHDVAGGWGMLAAIVVLGFGTVLVFTAIYDGFSLRYPGHVSKTSVEIDHDIVRQAAAVLGTRTLRETIDAALHDVVNAKRRLELIALLSEEGRFDFDAVESAWGADT